MNNLTSNIIMVLGLAGTLLFSITLYLSTAAPAKICPEIEQITVQKVDKYYVSSVETSLPELLKTWKDSVKKCLKVENSVRCLRSAKVRTELIYLIYCNHDDSSEFCEETYKIIKDIRALYNLKLEKELVGE